MHFLSLIPSSETPVVVIPLKRHIVRALMTPSTICQAGGHFITSVRRSVHALSAINKDGSHSV